MKIGILSDLHLEFYKDPLQLIESLPWGLDETQEADILIIAGDIHPNSNIRQTCLQKLEELIGIPIEFCLGNHDFYGSTVETFKSTWMFQEKKFACTTLWTKLNKEDETYAKYISDFHRIRGLSFDKWNELNENQWQFLQDEDAEIVITHHLPTPQHIHPNYTNDPLNVFFTNDLDVTKLQKCKLWISGHTHSPLDFSHNGIRFIVNPVGYPDERKDQPKVKVVEI